MIRPAPRWLAAAALLTLAGMPTIARAQGAPTTLPGVSDPHLSPAQQARVNARNARFMKERAAIIGNSKFTPAQKEAKYKALVKTANADVLAIMTPAQQAVVKHNRDITLKYQQGQMARGAAFQQAHKAEFDAGKALTAKLNKSLTPAQNAQIKVIKNDANAQLQALNADTTSSPQAKQTRLQTIQADAQAKIEAILTPTQKADAAQLEQIKQKLASEAQATAAAGH